MDPPHPGDDREWRRTSNSCSLGIVSVAAPSRWVSSPLWDLTFMFSAGWVSGLLLLAGAVTSIPAAAASLFLANRLVALAHSWSTTYLVLWSPLLAEDRPSRRLRYQVGPLLLTLLSMGLGLGLAYWPPHFVPGSPVNPIWVAYLALFWVGHFWHFGNQDFGVLSLYRARAGQQSPWDRRADRLGTIALMWIIHPIIYLYVLVRSPLRQTVAQLLPSLIPLIKLAAPIALVAAGATSVALIAFELAKPTRSLPKLIYYLITASHPFILYFIDVGLFPFYVVAYLWSHWLIAIGLVARINTHHYAQGGVRSLTSAALRHAALILGIAVVVGFLTYPHDLLNLFSREDYRTTLSRIPSDKRGWVGLLLGFFLAEQLVHYYCDRVLFRFRDPFIRRTVAPLL